MYLSCTEYKSNLFQGDSEASGLSAESAFFDPDDHWEKEPSLPERGVSSTVATDTVAGGNGVETVEEAIRILREKVLSNKR